MSLTQELAMAAIKAVMLRDLAWKPAGHLVQPHPQSAMTLTQEQAIVAAAAMAPRVQALEELLAQQVQLLPEGDSDWATTREQLNIEHGALVALQNIGAGQ